MTKRSKWYNPILSVVLVLLAMFGAFIVMYEEIPATPEECESHMTMAKAVVERDLAWYQILVCEGPIFDLEDK